MGPIADLKKPIDLTILKEKSALITGGASGLGALIAEDFAKAGALVTIADINEDQGKSFVEELKQKNLLVNFVPTDVTDWSSQIAAFKSAIQYSGQVAIDIVVAAAGVGGTPFMVPDDGGAFLGRDPPQPAGTDSIFDVNAKGVLFTSKLAQHYFGLRSYIRLSRPRAAPFRKTVILIGSLAGYLELNAAGYTASKWAVRGIFRSIRSKMENLGYRTNLIAPWVMDTPMSKGLAGLCRQQGFPVGEAGDVAGVVVRCAVDDDICGRAIAVGAAENFDLRDDVEGLNAGVEMKSYLEGEAKDFMAFFGQRP